MSAFLRLLAVAAFLYGLWIVFLWVGQRSMAYPMLGVAPRRAVPPPGADVSWVRTGDEAVETWFLPARRAAGARAPAAIFAHGNGETIDDLPDLVAPLRDLGVGVLLVEYPGYGRSAGTPSEGSIRRTFAGAYDLAVRRADVDPKKVVVFGHSLGGGAVCTLLADRPVAAVILLSTFSSTRVFARRYLAPPFLLRDVFDNAAALRKYDGPVLILHGDGDRLVPVANAGELRRAAGRARVITYPCDHWCWDGPGVPMWRDVAAFLAEAAVIEAPGP